MPRKKKKRDTSKVSSLPNPNRPSANDLLLDGEEVSIQLTELGFRLVKFTCSVKKQNEKKRPEQ